MYQLEHASRALLPPVFDMQSDLPDLPRQIEPWAVAAPHSGACAMGLQACLARAEAHGGWRWPARPVVFLSDTHADAEGFLRSLVAAGVIARTDGDFALTAFGRQATILVGGDCLDKGPSNLEMLDALGALMAKGPDLHILAGNHDLRLRLAVESLRRPPHPLSEHLFVRMGRKILPLMREVADRYVSAADLAALPDAAACRARLMPPLGWAGRFAAAALGQMAPQTVASEIDKLERKAVRFEADMAANGLEPRLLLAAARRCHDLFFTPEGPYAWFYEAMDVVARRGSLLFVHAGLCDQMCATLATGGEAAVNAAFRSEAGRAPFAFYFGPLANLVRTKYRASDAQLTAAGVARLHRIGVHMVVQGHVNNHAGQRLLAKQGLLHLEGDITLDRASRAREGLPGIGAGATLIFPSGDVIGLSRDYPRAKHFAPERGPAMRG